MTVYLCPLASILQYFNNTGVVLSGGKINTYVAGTSTPQTTYTDNTGTVSNSNPIVLNAFGQLQNVNIWQPSGVKLKVIVTDSSGNQIGPTFDQIAGIDDPTDYASLLANPASGDGADLVANAMRSYDLIASVRSANAPSLAVGQTLVIDIQAGTTPGDGLGGLFYWNASSSAADDGVNVIKPNSESGNGRYLRQQTVSSVSFTATIQGCTAFVTGNVFVTLGADNIITLKVTSALTGVSNANSLGFTGLPAAFQPIDNRIVSCMLEDNGGSAGGWATVGASGTVTFGIGINNNTAGFTASGTKGFPVGWTISYPL